MKKVHFSKAEMPQRQMASQVFGLLAYVAAAGFIISAATLHTLLAVILLFAVVVLAGIACALGDRYPIDARINYRNNTPEGGEVHGH
jgi:hypothetical protein